jgi:hypothetical protein
MDASCQPGKPMLRLESTDARSRKAMSQVLTLATRQRFAQEQRRLIGQTIDRDQLSQDLECDIRWDYEICAGNVI